MLQKWKMIRNRIFLIIDLLIAAIIVGTTVFLFVYWKYIPNQVPLHWGIDGQITRLGDTSSLVVPVIFMYFLWAWHGFARLLTGLFGKENLFEKDVVEKATQNDVISETKYILYLIWYTDLLIIMIFAYIVVCGALVIDLGVWFLPLFIVIIGGTTIYFLIKIYRMNGIIRRR